MKNNNKKYYIVKDKDIMTTLKVLTRQEPYVYPNKYDKEKFVWSFINDEVFQETLTLVLETIAKNKNR